MNSGIKKIVVLGPESTGKSTLCKLLAEHFNTIWCTEYAREYLLANGTGYTFNDLLAIAKGQLALEAAAESLVVSRVSLENSGEKSLVVGHLSLENSQGGEPLFTNDPRPTTHDSTNGQRPSSHYLFLDTDQYVMKVWCEFVFGDCHNWILRRIAERPYDLYLLCNIDLPWVKDELREYPNEGPRQQLYHIYKDMMINQNTPWIDISGNYEQRLQKAIDAVNTHFAT